MNPWTENPTSQDVLDAALEHGTYYYRIGWDHGYRQAVEDAAQDAQNAARAALVAQAGVESLDVVRARQRAAERPGVGPAARWSA